MRASFMLPNAFFSLPFSAVSLERIVMPAQADEGNRLSDADPRWERVENENVTRVPPPMIQPSSTTCLYTTIFSARNTFSCPSRLQ